MSRAIVIVLDSVGIGASADAPHYGDTGSDTVGNIARACAVGAGDRDSLRRGPLHLPHLVALGLGDACRLSTGTTPPGLEGVARHGLHGYAVERSKGKDTPSGHWEIAGFPVPFEWGYFPHTIPCFPRPLIQAICIEAGLPGILGDKHASGTEIIEAFGAESVSSGKPIFYTSADSVLQIAAHETAFGLERLYDLCRIARRHVDPLNIGRVIARPFIGDAVNGFTRTANRHDYAVPPPADTILDKAAKAGRDIITIGKIGDIFAHRSVGENIRGKDNNTLVDATIAALGRLPDGGFLFANYVDFDTLFGHRRDVPGYAAALEAFDQRLPDILAALRADDLLIITADHGCDPTFAGTDHTREHVPVLVLDGTRTGSIGRRGSFADIGASVAARLDLPSTGFGESFV